MAEAMEARERRRQFFRGAKNEKPAQKISKPNIAYLSLFTSPKRTDESLEYVGTSFVREQNPKLHLRTFSLFKRVSGALCRAYEGSWDVAENKVACLAFFIYIFFDF